VTVERRSTTAVEVAQVVEYFRCGHCQDLQGTAQDILDHIIASHPIGYKNISNWSDYLPLARDLGLIGSVPSTVYQCSYCPHIVKGDQPINLNDAMAEHQHQHHRSESGFTKLQFRIISDVKEIERLLQQRLPPIWQCRSCGEVVPVFQGAEDPQWQSHVYHHAKEWLLPD
jgi:rubredoxin